jgi:hypothetical protein
VLGSTIPNTCSYVGPKLKSPGIAHPGVAYRGIELLVQQKKGSVKKLSADSGLVKGGATCSGTPLTKSCGCLGSQSLLQTSKPSHLF